MPSALLALLLLIFIPSGAFAECSQSEICQMLGKLNHFAILDKCPNAGPKLVECKKVSVKKLEELATPNFVDNKDGTITDTANKLLWIKKGILNKVSLKDAKKYAETATVAGKSGWRLPKLAELKTLVYDKRVLNASGKKSWINPLFDDGVGHYYWTSTTCADITEIEDRYQKKICQQGDAGAWLVHFNINAIFWHHTKAENYHIWLVQNLE